MSGACQVQLDWSSAKPRPEVRCPWQVWEHDLWDLQEEEALAQLSWLSGGSFCCGQGSVGAELQAIHKRGAEAVFAELPEDQRQVYVHEATLGLRAFCTFWHARTAGRPNNDGGQLEGSFEDAAAAWGTLPPSMQWHWEARAAAAGAPERGSAVLATFQRQLALLGFNSKRASWDEEEGTEQPSCRSPAASRRKQREPETPTRAASEPLSPRSEAPTSPPRTQKRLVDVAVPLPVEKSRRRVQSLELP
eukprot:CAMPEP_0171100752 /NCGR_PEP_ID=MMETSP0766_2-20121228/53141_1 /TAXON_ID=439317 /ORGANISM="Gambierdiscus australes, Strain CAWD 149" /LENGTH=247 /DNA_ID=CAMNT_0011560629 /DNA_START=64 /DNA_END=807 /DNA_ORIENTATION=+